MLKETKKRISKEERIAKKQEEMREKQRRKEIEATYNRRLSQIEKKKVELSNLDYCPVCLLVHLESPPDQCWTEAAKASKSQVPRIHNVYLHFKDYVARKRFGHID